MSGDESGAWGHAALHPGPVRAVRRWPAPRQPTETALAQAARYARDRRYLARLDDRLLRDVGLDRGALEDGTPFRQPSPPNAESHPFWKRTP
ncbi:DUF1127 domain-containing protein [Paeniroseomonas aquatica]|uniref:DUF1127 domain-containing protein n=1 Tax=Paeniroseomonas aquatica TaxID=373043 RepID=A0ABT7ZZL2_9PROT|nr:DUF1127 domain-containing protein [Paeniroseomonas aquatica]MDN3562913.1 DUF1127 domain-containing protein [Paeniroseomonas aquatica]